MSFFCPNTRRPINPAFPLVYRADAVLRSPNANVRQWDFTLPINPSIDLNCDDESAYWQIALKTITVPTDLMTVDKAYDRNGVNGTSRFWFAVVSNGQFIGKMVIPPVYAPNASKFCSCHANCYLSRGTE